MDPSMQNVILGVVANVLTGFLAQLGRGTKRALGAEVLLESRDEQRKTLNGLLQQATNDLAESIDWTPPPSLEETCLFISSPEVEGILRKVYGAQLWSPEPSPQRIESIRREFTVSFGLYVGLQESDITPTASRLFQQILIAGQSALDSAIQRGLLPGHEAKSVARHHAVLDELTAIKRNIALLTTATTPSVKEILQFESAYRAQVAVRHAHIVPPHFDAARKIPIDDLYVASSFSTIPRRKDQHPDRVTPEVFLQSLTRAVILGNPGGGKSTFAQKVCHDLSERYGDRLLASRLLTPVLVVPVRVNDCETAAAGI